MYGPSLSTSILFKGILLIISLPFFDLIIEVLPKGLHQSVERFSAVLMLALGLFLTYAGWGYVAETRGSTSAAIGFPIELLYLSAPVFGVLVTLFSFERLMPWAESLNE